jgi:hypothetical protein
VTADVSMDDAIELLRRRLSTGVTFRIDSSETAVGFGQDCCGPVQRTTRYTVFVSRGGTHFVQACDFRLTDAVLIAVSEFAAQAAAAAAAGAGGAAGGGATGGAPGGGDLSGGGGQTGINPQKGRQDDGLDDCGANI